MNKQPLYVIAPLTLVALLAFSSCSSSPAFRRAIGADDDGYSVQDSTRKEVFDITARLSSSTDPRTRGDYLIRAAGEECLARGFLFFDVGQVRPATLRVFCYPDKKKLSLGVLMDQKAAADAKKPELRVEDTLVNSHTPMRPRDLVRKIGGKEVETIGAFKEEIYKMAAENRKSVTVLVERSGIALSLEAPFSEQKDGVFTPEMLENVRSIVP